MTQFAVMMVLLAATPLTLPLLVYHWHILGRVHL
jgi:hypothetical protein